MKEARTDVSGAFSLEGLSRRPHRIEALGGGLAPKALEVDLARETDLDIRLERGIPFGGRVVDARGEPVKGLEIMAGAEGLWSFPPVTTGGDGRFGYEAVPEGLELWLTAHPYFHTKVTASREPLEITVPDKVKLELRLVNARDGSPFKGPGFAHVRWPAGGEHLPFAEGLDDEGAITCEVQPPGPFEVNVCPTGGWTERVRVELLADGRLAPLTVRLHEYRFWSLRNLCWRAARGLAGLWRAAGRLVRRGR